MTHPVLAQLAIITTAAGITSAGAVPGYSVRIVSVG